MCAHMGAWQQDLRLPAANARDISCAGFELYALGQGRQSLSLTWKHAHPVFWWRYSHAARLLLLGTGDFGLWLQVRSFATC